VCIRVLLVLCSHFEREIFEDMAMLNVRPPQAVTRVSEYIPEIIAYIRGIEARGFTYTTSEGVYFSTGAFGSRYGKLAPSFATRSGGAAGGNTSDVAADSGSAPTARSDFDVGAVVGRSGKRDERDFVLWKFTPPAAGATMEWDSPWGAGRPGWHIECSAMSDAALGSRLDVHSGGVDLAFPHHTNEIAQVPLSPII
jgi:cysteinyl-tRNA synthetase